MSADTLTSPVPDDLADNVSSHATSRSRPPA